MLIESLALCIHTLIHTYACRQCPLVPGLKWFKGPGRKVRDSLLYNAQQQQHTTAAYTPLLCTRNYAPSNQLFSRNDLKCHEKSWNAMERGENRPSGSRDTLFFIRNISKRLKKWNFHMPERLEKRHVFHLTFKKTPNLIINLGKDAANEKLNQLALNFMGGHCMLDANG